MKSYDNYNEELAAYALDALDAAETREISAQIVDDARLAAELENWRDVAASLVDSVAPVEPPFQTRARILAAVKRIPSGVEGTSNNADNSSVAGFAQKSNVVTFPSRSPRTSFFGNWATAGAIAASFVALFLGVLLFYSVLDNREKAAQLSAANERLLAAQQKINETSVQLDRERQERELLASPASAVFALGGTPEMPNAQARLAFDKKTGRAVLFVENLPNAPEGKTYQIWWITDPKNPAPGGTFDSGASGKGELRDQIPDQFISASIFAVTLEPTGGSQSPTSKPILITPLS